jgi:hypothetical protein
MATRQAITRLAARIDQLDARRRPRWTVVNIPAPMFDGGLEDSVIERHMKMFPEARGSRQVIVIKKFGPVDPGAAPSDQADLAWRSIAEEQASLAALAFWEVPTDALPQ